MADTARKAFVGAIALLLWSLVDVIVGDKDPAAEDVTAVLFAKESRT